MARLTQDLFAPMSSPEGPFLLGVLEGEGIGPEVVGVALRALSALERAGFGRFLVRQGGVIGRAAEARSGAPLSEEVVRFCAETFASQGAILAGPGGGRFVYDLRRRFDLYCKLSPLRPSPALAGAARFKAEHLAGVDILIVRENTGGVYQGRWAEGTCPEGGRTAEHTFGYSEREVRRILEAGAAIAARRRGRLHVIAKEGGVPSVSRLWREVAGEVAKAHAVAHEVLDGDHAAYRLIQHAKELDVLVAPNLLGDILADLGASLLGSRGLSFSGNFDGKGAAVYQTNHGSAYDLAGTGRANPAGQVLSLAMALRESFGLLEAAALLEAALEDVWRSGLRTADVAEAGARTVGMAEIADQLVQAIERRREANETTSSGVRESPACRLPPFSTPSCLP